MLKAKGKIGISDPSQLDKPRSVNLRLTLTHLGLLSILAPG